MMQTARSCSEYAIDNSAPWLSLSVTVRNEFFASQGCTQTTRKSPSFTAGTFSVIFFFKASLGRNLTSRLSSPAAEAATAAQLPPANVLSLPTAACVITVISVLRRGEGLIRHFWISQEAVASLKMLTIEMV